MLLSSDLLTLTTATDTRSPSLKRLSMLGRSASTSFPSTTSVADLSLLVKSVEMLVIGTEPTKWPGSETFSSYSRI